MPRVVFNLHLSLSGLPLFAHLLPLSCYFSPCFYSTYKRGEKPGLEGRKEEILVPSPPWCCGSCSFYPVPDGPLSGALNVHQREGLPLSWGHLIIRVWERIKMFPWNVGKQRHAQSLEGEVERAGKRNEEVACFLVFSSYLQPALTGLGKGHFLALCNFFRLHVC